ncbi:MAG: exosortase [Planctomycetota bacterium]|jgi:exosortase
MKSIKAIILVGSRDFGRCPIASRLPTALWPVAGKPVLERLLCHLADQGIKQAVICGNGASSLLDKSYPGDDRLTLSFFDETLPMGTAGCIREGFSDETEELLMVFPAGIVSPPKIDVLIKAHHDGKSDLTVLLNPCRQDSGDMSEASGIYVCNPGILEYIPKAGYFDVKEGLIPKMLHAGRTVHASKLPYNVGNFRNRQEYLSAVTGCLDNVAKMNADLKPLNNTDSENVWSGVNAKVDPEAKIYGPVVILDGATVSGGAVVLGPAVLGKNAAVKKNSVVINSVLWDDAKVGSNCQIQRSVVDYHGVVRDNSVVEEKSVSFELAGVSGRAVKLASMVVKNNAGRFQLVLKPLDEISKKFPKCSWLSRKNILAFLASGFVFVVFLWSYWPGLVELWKLWRLSDEYSSGLLVPFLAVYVLWARRHDIACCPVKPSLWGLFAFAGVQLFRLFGLLYNYSSAERLSIVLSIAALILLLFGWKFFRKMSPILLFLCLMLPLPSTFRQNLGLNLQRWATSSAVFCLEVIGYAVIQDGHTIDIGGVSVAVLEACNGLRMITAFFVISGLVVLLVQRAWWEKLVILVSSLPIAILCNTVRLTITAIFFTILEGEYWEQIFHDFGGYAMMPLALAAVVGELWLLAKLTVLPTKEKAIIITRQEG